VLLLVLLQGARSRRHRNKINATAPTKAQCAPRAGCAPLLCVQLSFASRATILGDFELFLFTTKFLEAMEEHSIPKQEWGWGLINMKNSRPLPLG
jgi:hypothetical protein